MNWLIANFVFLNLHIKKKGKSVVLRTSVKIRNIENHCHIKEHVLCSAVTVDYPRERNPLLRSDRSRFYDSRIKLVALLREPGS